MKQKLKSIKAGVIFHRYGPYHIVRIDALNKAIETVGIELSGITKEYQWDKVAANHFDRITLFADQDSREASVYELKIKLYETLNKIKPDVMLINGWGDKGGLITLKWCLQNKIPAILMTEEISITFRRTWIKEFPKKRIVKLFDAALVGGDAQVRYVKQLGMPGDLIERGYDVIDNDHFAGKSRIVNHNKNDYKEKYNLPDEFFLTSNRFIPKKNLFRLLEAYKRYVLLCGAKSWHLVMLGDGELKQAIIEKIAELDLQEKVILPGFLQYDTLPDYYALAKVFIHASTSEQWGLVVNEAMAAGLPVIVSNQCGCSENLVKDGVNGYSFDAYQTDQLKEKMVESGKKTNDELKSMGEMSRKIIADFSPESFAKNTLKLIERIDKKKIFTKSLFSRLVLNLVIRYAAIK